MLRLSEAMIFRKKNLYEEWLWQTDGLIENYGSDFDRRMAGLKNMGNGFDRRMAGLKNMGNDSDRWMTGQKNNVWFQVVLYWPAEQNVLKYLKAENQSFYTSLCMVYLHFLDLYAWSPLKNDIGREVWRNAGPSA